MVICILLTLGISMFSLHEYQDVLTFWRVQNPSQKSNTWNPGVLRMLQGFSVPTFALT